jgi:hypothetical protein
MTVKDRLEFFDSGHGLTAVKLGLIPLGQLVSYDLYKTYCDFLDSGKKKSDARALTMKSRHVKSWDVTRALYFFEPDAIRKRKKRNLSFAKSCKST